jgi:sigma-E factor negative regulatory protein RseB
MTSAAHADALHVGWLPGVIGPDRSSRRSTDPSMMPRPAATHVGSRRKVSYEGVFVMQHGASCRPCPSPIGRSAPPRKAAGGNGRRRTRNSLQRDRFRQPRHGRRQIKLEKRLNSRYFPDLLPPNAAALASWYGVKLGERSPRRRPGMPPDRDQPKDEFRWGYVLCADKDTGLPLKAVMVNGTGQPLMQYAFAEIRIGGLPGSRSARSNERFEQAAWTACRCLPRRRARSAGNDQRQQPAARFQSFHAVKRKLPNKPDEVEHWVFSDGLTHISLFLEPARNRSRACARPEQARHDQHGQTPGRQHAGHDPRRCALAGNRSHRPGTGSARRTAPDNRIRRVPALIESPARIKRIEGDTAWVVSEAPTSCGACAGKGCGSSVFARFWHADLPNIRSPIRSARRPAMPW